VDDAAVRVDDASLLGRHQAHPGRPALLLGERPADGLREPRRGGRVRVEEQQEVARGAASAQVRCAREAVVARVGDDDRLGSEPREELERPVLGGVVDDDELVASDQLRHHGRQRHGDR
jgi:hypothetical protein